MRFLYLVFFISTLLSFNAWAFESFVVKDIKVKGLQRITLGTTFTYLPIKVGDQLDNAAATNAIRSLYKTGFFENIILEEESGLLVITVVERPSISSIKIFGNEEIGTEDLNDALKNVGLKEGLVFNKSILDQVEQELRRQYFSLGKYGIKIDSTVSELARNRVDIQIDIDEGEAAHIKNIVIIGTKAFSQEKLLDKLELTMPSMFSKITGSESYSKQQLVADLEMLKSFYLDRGFINFNVESTQVSISPDKRDVFITINISEGEQYTIKGIKISGDTIIKKEDVLKLIQLKKGEVFSRKKLVGSSNNISRRLAIDGYAFAKVNAIPDINSQSKEITVTYFIDPGKRVYVRRINIYGNTKTKDSVIRRELRQMEGGWISTPLIDRSKVRLQRLGFFGQVKVETPAVPGTTDQVDVNFEVTEGSTGNFTAGLGYGQTGGFLFNTSVTLNNYLGTGKRVSLEINNSKINKIYSFSLRNPYFTKDGVSRGFRVFSRATDASKANLADFTSDSYGASMNFSIPMSEYTRFRSGFSFENTEISVNNATAPFAYQLWIDQNGNSFDSFNLTASYSFDSRNRAIFPDKGVLSRFSAELAIPGGDVQYYKVNFQQKWYFQLSKSLTFLLGGDFSGGDGYGDTSQLPFYKNYYLGGYRSLRGFRGNTVGPKDEQGDSIGGYRRITARAELFFPSPFSEERSQNFKLGAFIDAGRLYNRGERASSVIFDNNGNSIPISIDTVIEDDAIRSSYGLSAVWITPVGALTFTFARPLKSYPGDRTEFFSFNIGSPF